MPNEAIEFGKRLKLLRKQAGLSQKQLAEKIGYDSQGAISMFESGEREPSWSVVKALAEALGVELTAFNAPSKIALKKKKNV